MRPSMTSTFQGSAVLERPPSPVRAGDVRPTPSGALRSALGTIALSIHDDLAEVESDWRQFETSADCTVFQTFAWQSLWRKHMGAAAGVQPAIVIGRERDRILFIFPLAVEHGRKARRLVWHTGSLADYNAPLLAPAFAASVDRPRFLAIYAEIIRMLTHDKRFAPDAVIFDKMPETVGGQPNPFMALDTQLNPSGAYATRLFGDWESFYVEKRSSATRRRDRTKRKRFADIGPVQFVTATDDADIAATYNTLIEQKTSQFAALGVGQLFERPGLKDLFLELATGHRPDDVRVHISRLEIGGATAATNFGIIFQRRYYHIFASYDGSSPAARFGPGAAHLHDLMAYAIDAGCDVFDFTIGDEPYKREWADITIALRDHHRSVTVLGFAVAAPSAAWARAKGFIKRSPKLWALAQKVRAQCAAWTRKSANPET